MNGLMEDDINFKLNFVMAKFAKQKNLKPIIYSFRANKKY